MSPEQAKALRLRFRNAEEFIAPSWSNLEIAKHLDGLRKFCAPVLGRTHHVTVELSHLKSDAMDASSVDRILSRLRVLRERAIADLPDHQPQGA